MNDDLFLYALLPISSAKGTAEWMVDNSHAHYHTVDIVDFPEDLLENVFELYEASYGSYKSQLISHSHGLLKYNRWIMFYDDDDPEKRIVCFGLFKTTNFGLKSGLTGSDGSKNGKRAVLSFKISSFNTQGVFGEISGRLEERIIKDVPAVTFEKAKAILEHFGKTDVKIKSGNHYSREIGNLGVVVKIMVGLPGV